MAKSLDASLIDRLAATAQDAREVIREAHQAQRDLKVAIREAQAEAVRWSNKASLISADSPDEVRLLIAQVLKANADALEEKASGIMTQRLRHLEQQIGQWIEDQKEIVEGSVARINALVESANAGTRLSNEGLI